MVLSEQEARSAILMDASSLRTLQMSAGVNPGRTPWLLVRFARLPKEDKLDGYDREYWRQLGFTLGADGIQSASTDEKSLMHCCCEEGSLLSNPIRAK